MELRSAVEREQRLPVELKRYHQRRAQIRRALDVRNARVGENGNVEIRRFLGLLVVRQASGDFGHWAGSVILRVFCCN